MLYYKLAVAASMAGIFTLLLAALMVCREFIEQHIIITAAVVTVFWTAAFSILFLRVVV